MGQAAQAFFAVAAADRASAEAAARLLSRLRPSAKVLGAFKTHIEVGTAVHPPAGFAVS